MSGAPPAEATGLKLYCLGFALGLSRPNRVCAILLARIVAGIQVLEAKRPNRCYLSDVFAGLCPVKVGGIARQNDDAARRIRVHHIAVELIAQADIEDSGHNCVDTILRMS